MVKSGGHLYIFFDHDLSRPICTQAVNKRGQHPSDQGIDHNSEQS